MGESKPALSSRTIWGNILYLVVVLIGTAIANEWVAENPQVVSVLVAVQSALNIALRFISVQPIHVVGGKE